MNNNIIFESCKENNMSDYPCFFDQLARIENFLNKQKGYFYHKGKKIYVLGNIIWNSKIKNKINNFKYPSDYFIKTIINTQINDNYIINPPIIINDKNKVSYILLTTNQQLVMDALMKQGSRKRYYHKIKNSYLYSEYSGAISIRNKNIDKIVIFTDTDRLDTSDDNIFLPKNSDDLLKYEYLFHTHPNTDIYGGRLEHGIIYEFPSVNDIFNFIKYYNEGCVLASIIIAPEGSYIIRPVSFLESITLDNFIYDKILSLILILEKMAIRDKKIYLKQIKSNEDAFHKYIGDDFKYISILNRLLITYNIFIEYFPREKKNNEWMLKPISLLYMKNK